MRWNFTKSLKRFSCIVLILCTLVLPVSASEHLLIAPAPAKDDWGVTMTLKDVTSTGATIVFTQSGGDESLFSHPQACLLAGAEYFVETLKDGQWKPLDVLIDNLGWIAMGYIVPLNGSKEFPVAWEGIYGELPAGTYRIAKSLLYDSYESTGEKDTRMYYVEFNIAPEDTDAWLNPFIDVSQKDWFYKSVEYVYKNDIMKGKSATIFSPGSTTTRGQFVTTLWRMSGSPVVNFILPFEDVNQNLYYTEAIRWATSENIVNGYADGNFHPDDPISRQQMAVFLWRYAQRQGIDVSVGEDTNILSYSDSFDISDYAFPAIQWAYGAGIMGGDSANRIDPHGIVNRAYVAYMMEKFKILSF